MLSPIGNLPDSIFLGCNISLLPLLVWHGVIILRFSVTYGFYWFGAYGSFYSLFDLRVWGWLFVFGFHLSSFMYLSASCSVLIVV